MVRISKKVPTLKKSLSRIIAHDGVVVKIFRKRQFVDLDCSLEPAHNTIIVLEILL